jgi:hypothetical protein
MCIVGYSNNSSFLTQKIGPRTRGNDSWVCGVISIQREPDKAFSTGANSNPAEEH